MKPIKSIASRYSLTNISTNSYQSISINNNQTINNNQGYVYAPYILTQKLPIIIDSYCQKQLLISERKEKLKKLWN